MPKLEVVKEMNKQKLKKDGREEVQLVAKFKNHRPAFLIILKKFESMWG